MISVAIVEDDFFQANGIKDVLVQNGYGIFGIYPSAESFLTEINEASKNPDLVLLDVKLSGILTGLNLAEKYLSVLGIEFIFVSSNVEHQNYLSFLATSPAAIIIKPYNDLELLMNIKLAIQKTGSKLPNKSNFNLASTQGGDFVFIRSKGGLKRLIISDIKWIEGNGSYSDINMPDQTMTVSHNLRSLEESLKNASIVRIHRSFLVNLDYIELIKDDYLMCDGSKLPISRRGKRLLLAKFKIL